MVVVIRPRHIIQACPRNRDKCHFIKPCCLSLAYTVFSACQLSQSGALFEFTSVDQDVHVILRSLVSNGSGENYQLPGSAAIRNACQLSGGLYFFTVLAAITNLVDSIKVPFAE